MALINKYMEEEQNRINNQKQTGTVQKYNTSPVSAAKRSGWQVTQPAAVYTPNENPGTYTSRYQGTLDSILAQLSNPDEFHYEFNGDELFKSYADLYTQKGKQASLDAMGQAAGLTGGYGSSYGQQVGQQTYQNYLLGLYDKGLELRDRAYGMYRDQLGDLQNLYQNYMNAETMDYGKYSDALSDYRTYEAQQEAIRQFNEKMAFEQAQAAEDARRWNLNWDDAHQDAGSGGYGGPGGGTGHYEQIGGRLYSVSNDGSYSEVDPAKVTGTYSDDYDTFWNKGKILANTAHNTDLLKLKKK